MSINIVDSGNPDGGYTPNNSKLYAPTSFNIKDASTTVSTMSLEWVAPVNRGTADGYRVFDDNGVQQGSDIPWGTLTAEITGLSVGTAYTYKVATYDDVGISDYSNSDTDTTLATDLNPHTNFARTGTPAKATSLEFTWTQGDRGTAAGSYIYDDLTDLPVTNSIPWDTTVATVSGLTPDTDYSNRFKIATYDAITRSAFSNLAGDSTIAQSATLLYSEDFENGMDFGVVNPVLKTARPAGVEAADPLVASGSIFEIDTTVFNSGTQSLRHNQAGRNGICNIPLLGVDRTEVHKISGYDNTVSGGTAYFVSNDDTELSAEVIGTGTPIQIKKNSWTHEVGDIVHNTTNGFSKWEITSFASVDGFTDNKLNLTLLLPPIDGSTAGFTGGDDVVIAHITDPNDPDRDLQRYSDCNLAILTLNGWNALDYGGWVYHRKYIMFDLTSCTEDYKLLYLGAMICVIILDHTTNKFRIYIDYPGKAPGLSNRKLLHTLDSDIVMNQWYYLELGLKVQTFAGAYDGEVKAWLYKKGEEKGEVDPSYTDNKLDVPLKTHNTVFGNHKLNCEASGFVWLDDVEISTEYIGPIV